MADAGPDVWLHDVYSASGNPERIRSLYNDWAKSYDSDMLAVGYVHPAVLAGMACRHIRDLATPILDAGAGTGLIGNLLHILGFTHLIGIDMSEGMLERAGTRGVYHELKRATLGEPLDFADNAVGAVVSTGTFTTGHAPASAWEELLRIVRPGGILMSTFATTIWEANGFRAAIEALMNSNLLAEVEVTAPYAPLPNSAAEAHVMTRLHVYRKLQT